METLYQPPELPEWPEYLTDDQLTRHLAIHERGRQTEEDTVERLRGELRRREVKKLTAPVFELLASFMGEENGV